MAVEIEWRFAVKRVGTLPPCGATPIRQGYVNPGSPVVRARMKGSTGYISIKAPLGRSAPGEPAKRLEFEYEIPAEDAEALIRLSPLRTEKTRYLLPDGMEIDVFGGPHRGLVIAEVEVAAVGDPPTPPPGWEWTDVSADGRYTNRGLAEYGLPEGAPLIDDAILDRVFVHIGGKPRNVSSEPSDQGESLS